MALLSLPASCLPAGQPIWRGYELGAADAAVVPTGHAALDAQLPLIQLPPELAARSRGVTEDPTNPIYARYGENALKSRLRAHPDVAAIHHADLLAARA